MRLCLLPVALLTVAACASTPAKETPRTAAEQRAHDSVLARSKVPNASAVGSAMRVADSLGKRVERQDSAAAVP